LDSFGVIWQHGNHTGSPAFRKNELFPCRRTFPLIPAREAPSGDVSQGLEGGEDAGDLIGAFLVLPAEAGGEDFGVLADGWQELAEGGDLGGQFGRPVEDDGGGGFRSGIVVLS